MRQWKGARQGDAAHRAIIDAYNAIRPLPRGYKMTYSDPWCAATASAAASIAGYLDIIPPECSCGAMIDLFKAHPLSRWEEDDAYVPQAGDLIFYAWGDGADWETTDCKKPPDHVGVVADARGLDLTVIEGNKGGGVGERQMRVNGQHIRGYGLPAYHLKAGGDGQPKEELTMAQYEELIGKIDEVGGALAGLAGNLEKVSSDVGDLLARHGKRYKTRDDVRAEWKEEGIAAVEDAMRRGILKGVAVDDLGLTYDNVRALVWAYRREKAAETIG
jgi:hypothetical protein